MNFAQEVKKVNMITPPFQPSINTNVKTYREKLVNWNPVCLKKQALFYQFSTDNNGHVAELVPDACFNILIKCSEKSPESWVSGIFSGTFELKLEPNTTYFGIKPYSNVAIKENKVHLRELSNQTEELGRIFNNSDFFVEEILKKKSFLDRIEVFKSFAEEEVIDYSYESDFIDYFTVFSCVAEEAVVFKSLVEQTGYSQRYLREKFKEHFGISPKVYTSILRFQHVLKDYLQKENIEDNNFFLNYGYYDQAHFIKEFKKFASSSPALYRKEYLSKII